MILVIRRRYLLMTLCLILTGLAAIVLLSKRDQISAFTADRVGNVIIIDAGHGGADGGAVSQNGVIESTLNLEIARKTYALFCFLGQNAAMTRTGEDGLYEPDSHTIRQKKVADTRNRVALVNGYASATLISIHQNSLPAAPKVHGAQVFYNSQPHAQELANVVQAALNAGVNIGNEKAISPIPKSVYLMAHVNCDAILVECGFLSNTDDTQLLQDMDHQRKLAAAIVCGYLNE